MTTQTTTQNKETRKWEGEFSGGEEVVKGGAQTKEVSAKASRIN